MPKRIRGDWPVPMTHAQMVEAARLFFKCEYTTHEIAHRLEVGEHDVWNSMAFIHAVRLVDEQFRSDKKGNRRVPKSALPV